MSPNIIIVLVGVVLLVLSFFSGKLRATLGVLGVLLIIYGGFTIGVTSPQTQTEQIEAGNEREVTSPVDKVMVTSPIPGDSIACRTLTRGVYPADNDNDIWVLLKPSDNRYYPQSDHTNTSFKRNGEFQVITRFGGDQGEKYELIVVEADASTSSFFTATIEEWKSNETYPGLNESDIPDGAKEVDRISVYLKENCRGVF